MKRRSTPSVPWPAVNAASHRQLTGRDRSFWDSRLFSLRAALTGAILMLRTQPNARIELASATLVSLAGWWIGLSTVEWAVLALTFFLVLALEAVNTAIEALVDLASPQYHPLAKQAKDVAAGAMIFIVLGSICVALAIFGPRLWALLP
jgi:diacylglycerol kinase (ATP)